MQHDYTKAFLALLSSGTPVDTALAGLMKALKAKHHTKLAPAILHEALRVLEAEKGVETVKVVTATKNTVGGDAAAIAAALKALQVPEGTTTTTEVDETLIGGFVVTYNHHEYDQSYKRVLKSLYESITA